MQPIYYDDEECAGSLFAWEQNGYDAGPLLERQDPYLANERPLPYASGVKRCLFSSWRRAPVLDCVLILSHFPKSA